MLTKMYYIKMIYYILNYFTDLQKAMERPSKSAEQINLWSSKGGKRMAEGEET